MGTALLLYVLLRGVQARPAGARPDLRDHLPDRAAAGLLGPVRAGRRLAEPVHRPLSSTAAACRRRCSSRSTRSTSSCSARSSPGCGRALGRRRSRAFDPGQVRPGPAPARLRLPRPRLGRGLCRNRRPDPGPVPVPHLPVPHHRRALPVAGGPQRDEPAGAAPHGEPDHGRLVLRHRGRQFRRRQDRRGDRRRRGRRDDQGRNAGDLLDDRPGRDRRSASPCWSCRRWSSG